jgi:acetate kinase
MDYDVIVAGAGPGQRTSSLAGEMVFAGGIGENAPEIRARTCDGLGFLGLQLTEARHAANAAVISANASRVTARVIRTDEELMIARAMERVAANVENSEI